VTVHEFLSRLRQLDVRVWAEGDKLRYSAPDGVMTTALRTDLIEHKAEIIAFLHRIEGDVHLISPPLLPVSREGELPLSFAQQRLWFLDKLEPNNPAYNCPGGMRFIGLLNVAVLGRCINEIIRRHETLRTTFATVDGRAIQVIAPPSPMPLPLVDLCELPESEREGEARRLGTEETHRPFDLARGPLVRVILLRLSEEEHALLLTLHHIISDAWSGGVLWQELATLYEASSRGKPSPLPELPIQYVDFAVWQREWLQGEVMDRLLTYWKQQLDDASTVLDLPTDRPRPPMQTYRGTTQSLMLSEQLSEALKTLSQQEGCTLFMTLLAAFNVLLYRYTNQKDILMGSPVAGRNRVEVEGLIGFFVNTLVLRTDLSGNPSFRELLRRTRETVLDAQAYQDLPFEKLVAELQIERDLSIQPLFQVMFALQNVPPLSPEFSDLVLHSLDIESRIAQFDLSITMTEMQEGIDGFCEYSTDLFDAATILRMLGHFQTLLAAIVSDPDQKIAEIPLLVDAEQEQFATWNATQRDFPLNYCFPQLFESQVTRTPDAIAVTFRDQQLTYRALNQRANRLARLLLEEGGGPDTVVALLAERGIDFLTAILAVFKVGGAYLPLDPRHPPLRHRQVLQQSGSQLMLVAAMFESTTIETLEGIPAETRPKLMLLEDLLQHNQPEGNLSPRALPTNLAYVIYTSGSTGIPKGAMVEHRGMLNHMYAKVVDLGLTATDVIAQTASQCFDISVWQFLAPLLIGGRVHILADEIAHDPVRLLDEVDRDAITMLETVPSLLGAMLDIEELEDSDRHSLPALRWLIPTGEALPPELCRRWLESHPQIPLVNAYGPTECSDDVTHHFIADPPSPDTLCMPIGRPIPNLQVYVLDQHLLPLPIGIVGEVYVGGIGVGRGYLNDARRTAEVFIPDLFAGKPGARLYRTGDLARYLPDGSIQYLNRVDHQVKIRGFRIELGEIETILRQHPAVRESVVMAREDNLGTPSTQTAKRLVAYVVPAGEQELVVGDLRRFVQEKLPDYMVPSAFMVLDALPLTPNGKVDRRALPVPTGVRPELERVFVAPRTSAEEDLASIWAEILGIEQVGVHDNFFELGGDSILCIQIIARARRSGVRITPMQFFEHQTVAELAMVANTAPDTQAEQGMITGPVPLTPIQRQFFEESIVAPHYFNQAMLLEVKQSLSPALLRSAFQRLLLHHDGLRLRFERTTTGWRQIIIGHKDGVASFTQIDLSNLPESGQSLSIDRATAALQASLDISTGPLVRVALFDLGEQGLNRLFIVIHHLSVDSVSWRILLEDLETAYLQLSRGEAIELPPKTTSFRQWAERLVEYAQSERIENELDYWTTDARRNISPLPVDYPGGVNTVASTDVVSVSLSADDTQALLREVPRVYQTQINDVLLTALTQAFTQWTGEDPLLIDLEGHGREEIFEGVDLSRTVGWFTSTFPVLLDLRGTQGLGEALKSVKEQLRQTTDRGIQYGVSRYLSTEAEWAWELHKLPRPEVIFNYLGQMDQILPEASMFRLAQESSGPHQSPMENRHHLIEIDGGVIGKQLQLSWAYSRNLHRRTTVEGLARTFVEALQALIAHCQSPEAGGYTPSDFPAARLTQEELDRFLASTKTLGENR
jgi:amino acid adenylation domain-containing protein/non-ribosomal peptide synthase protein (TIGR01720 family)